MIDTKIKAHKELLKLVKKYEYAFKESGLRIRVHDVESEIEMLEVEKTFGVGRLEKVATQWYRVGWEDDARIGYYREGERSISWSDDGRQPSNEWLYQISYPTGAYIFGDSYPKETFNKMFEEMKTYNPKYVDTANHVLYFTAENAKTFHDNLKKIESKYRGMVQDELNRKRKKELEDELKALEGLEEVSNG